MRVVPVCMVGKDDPSLGSSGPKSPVLDSFLNDSALYDMNGSD